MNDDYNNQTSKKRKVLDDYSIGTESDLSSSVAGGHRSKNGRVVDAMMSAAVTSFSSSVSSTNEETLPLLQEQDDRQDHLLNPRHKTGLCWKYFKLYDPRHHSNMKDKANCTLCHADISIKGRTTTGLTKHLKHKHLVEWEALNERKASSFSSSMVQPSVGDVFPRKFKEKTPDEIKVELIHASTNFVIANCMPFIIVENPAFRNLFRPFHKDADKITNISATRVRDEVFNLGALAKRATRMEVALYKGSWTTDHWTGKDDATYTTTTFHYIKKWRLRSIIVDFKVFHGTTTGEAIYNDQMQVLTEYTTKANIVIGITDTTSSMGVLGQYLHSNGMQHAYCTDHNLQCNAVLAFHGKRKQKLHIVYQIPMPYLSNGFSVQIKIL